MNEFRTKLTPKEREEAKEIQRQNKISSKMKFSTISEMRQHHAAINLLYKNGYEPASLKQLSYQFLESVEYALQEVESLRNSMQKIHENPY